MQQLRSVVQVPRARWSLTYDKESILELPTYSLANNPYTRDLHIKPGKGSFASVYSATKYNEALDNSVTQLSTFYALKVITITSSKKRKMARKEIDILTRLQNHPHRNVLRLEEAFFLEDPRTIILATQPYAPLSLERFFTKTLLYDREEWYEPHRLRPWPEITRQCLEGLHFLHTRDPPILHLDLKPQNILLWKFQDSNGPVVIQPIIADFGISSDLPIENSNQQGTLEYMSPEVLDGASQTIYSDMWALGCCFAQIFVLLYSGERALAELRDVIHEPDRPEYPPYLTRVRAILSRSDVGNHPHKAMQIFFQFQGMVSKMLHSRADYVLRPTTGVALAYHRDIEAHLQIKKLDISRLTICSVFGSKRVLGCRVLTRSTIGENIRVWKRDSKGQLPVICTGIWRFLMPFIRLSAPRFVYLTMAKDDSTDVKHIEYDFPSALSRKRKHSTYPIKLSADQATVNGTIQKLWKMEDWELDDSPRY